MKQVSTLAPPDVAAAAIRSTYAGLVDPALIEKWASAPATAPGRQTSSPWPDRIEVKDVSETRVTGELVEATSTGDARRVPVEVTLRREGDRWLISGYQTEASPVSVLESYYAAISARDYAKAYGLWGSSGPPNQTLAEFTSGFADTASASVKPGQPSRVEPAAGSRYVEVPVTVTARTTAGAAQRFEGSYTLRRTVVDGAPPADREWHIYKATLRPSPAADPGPRPSASR
jgi:hypothetical protein